jgi:hypothetical protein
MTTLSKENHAPAQIKVSAWNGPVTDINHVAGATAAHYTDLANIIVGTNEISINGEPASLEDVVPEGAVIVVAPKIANG